MASVKTLILASTSPFRRALLASAGVQFEAAAPPVDEATLTAPSPAAQASLRAEAKALAMAAARPGALVIGADQVLSLDGRGFDKVTTAAAARQRLALLNGRTHYLHSGLALALGSRLLATRVVDTAMPMRRLAGAELDAYVATGEWLGSVGCYQFENRGVHLFQGVEGEHSAIIGLPLTVLLAELRAVGVDTLLAPAGPWEVTEP